MNSIVKNIIVGASCAIVFFTVGFFVGGTVTTNKYQHEAEIAAAELKSAIESNTLFRNEVAEQIDSVQASATAVQEQLLETVDIMDNVGSSVAQLRKAMEQLRDLNKLAFDEFEEIKLQLDQLED